jgi:hypothetical protein
VQYAEAFQKLGYSLKSIRNDWSAEKPDGICISIWTKEAKWSPSPPSLDLWDLHPEGGDWERKPGHAKRTRHLSRAVEDFDGFIDVILVAGSPGEAYDNATPWSAKERKGHVWRIVRFDPASGYFRAEAVQKPRKER